MRLEAIHREEAKAAGDAVDAWLRMLRGLLHVPDAQAAGICEELEMHLRERIRDLQVAGVDESEAIRAAIGELGDAAVLAGRFRSATRWRYRRLSMNIAIAIVAGTAAVLSVVAVSRMPQPAVQASAEAEQREATGNVGAAGPGDGVVLHVEPRIVDDQVHLLLRHEPAAFQDGAGQADGVEVGDLVERDITLEALLELVAMRMKLPLHVRWQRLEERGINRASNLAIAGRDLNLRGVFTMISEEFQYGPLDFRITAGVLEVADREFFDQRERVLVTYDIGPVLADGNKRFNQTRQTVLAELLETLHQFVSPESWADNGGSLASHAVVGDRLFVEAPPRMHRQIEWILKQLPAVAAAAPEQGAGAGETRIVKVHPLRSIGAADALESLQALEQLRNLDFGRFTIDPRTNAIIGAAPEFDHVQIIQALRTIDRPGPR